MDAVNWTTIAANVGTMIVSAGTVAGVLYAALIKPTREALSLATAKLNEFEKARVIEKLGEHDDRFKDHTQRLVNLRTEITQSFEKKQGFDHNERVGMHRRMDKQDTTLARLDERTITTNDTLKTIAEQVTELVAAVGKLSGRQGH